MRQCLLIVLSCLLPLFAANKKKGLPENFEVQHVGSAFANVLFEFHDTTGEAWPMFFHGKTTGEVTYQHNGGRPDCQFSATSSYLSLHGGDQSRKILGELVAHKPVEKTDKKGRLVTRIQTTYPVIEVDVKAAGALQTSEETSMKNGKERKHTIQTLPTKVTLKVNDKTISYSADTRLSARARDGLVGAVNWTTTATVSSKDLGIRAFSERQVKVVIATSLYPAKKKRKKKK